MSSILSIQLSAIRHQLFKILFAFIALAAYFLILNTNPAFAQTPATSSATTYQSAGYISPQSPNNATKAIYDFSHAMSCILVGESTIAPCLEYKTIKNAQGVISSIPVLSSVNTSNGLLGSSLSMIGAVMSTPPIRSSEFIANLGDQIGVKSAHAQVGGSGSGVLSSIFRLWLVSRNIAYLGMILIFIFVGFMVMFRQKLNPQTVVSVQMALPGLVIGLIMITFSYFLASLISDISFLGTNIVGYYFSLAEGKTNPTQLPLTTTTKWYAGGAMLPPVPFAKDTTEANVLTIFSRFTNIMPFNQIRDAINGIWVYLDDPNKELLSTAPQIDAAEALVNVARFGIYQFLSPLNTLIPGYGAAVAAVAGLGVGSLAPTGTVAFGLGLAATIALIYSMFKLLLRLLQNFLSIIFLTIVAPFYFLAASLPGRQGLMTNWFSNMLCNVLAFPAVFAVFYFVAFILGSAVNPEPLFQISSTTSLTGGTTFPLLGGLSIEFLNRLVAFGALLATPSIPDIICRAVGKPGQLGGLAAGAIGGAISSGQRYQGQTTSGITNLAASPGRLSDARGYQVNNGVWSENPYGAQAGLRTRIALNPFGQWMGNTRFGQAVANTRVGNRLFNVQSGPAPAHGAAAAAHATPHGPHVP